MVKPQSKGRQRVEIKKIQNKTRLGVTFTKRRNGLFKKASELITLCGIEVALLIFSPGKKVYSFGHPSVFAILERFVYHLHNSHPSIFSSKYVNAYHKSKIDQLYAQLDEIKKQAESEMKIAKEAKDASVEMFSRDNISLPQAIQRHSMMMELKRRISTTLENMFIKANNMNNEQPLEPSQTGGVGEMVINNCIAPPAISGVTNHVGGVGFNNLDAPGSSNNPNYYGSWM